MPAAKKKLDPYKELGVDRNATSAEIHEAFRRRAKETHPDKWQGDAERFIQAHRAMSILRDPKARRTFDETGEAEVPGPDNVEGNGLQMIVKYAMAITNEFLQAGMPAPLDPRRGNFLDKVRARCRKQIDESQAGLKVGLESVEFLRDLQRRIKRKAKGVDIIGRHLDVHIRQAEEQIKLVRQNIESNESALRILDGYTFEEMEEQLMISTMLWTPPTGGMGGFR